MISCGILNIEDIDDMLNIDLSQISDEALRNVFIEVQNRADRECYHVGIDYNIKDTELVSKLDDKMKLIDVALALAYDAKVLLPDVFTQVRMWDTIIHNHLWKKKIAVPPLSVAKKDSAYVGAFVKDPLIGGHDWVMSFDLTSLYPSLIMQYNISPEMLIRNSDGYPIKADVSVDQLLDETFDVPLINDKSGISANGCYFSKSKQGFLPEIINRMYNDRIRYKKLMIEAQKKYETTKDSAEKQRYLNEISRYKNMQMAKKIEINSAYGALGNQFFRFFDIDLATAITLGGQLTIRWAENNINKYMNGVLATNNVDYVIASDTDSLLICFNGLVHKAFEKKGISQDTVSDRTARIVSFLDKVASEKIEPFLDKIYSNLNVRMGAYTQALKMKREAIADRGIWTAKKRYILNVYDNEGVRYSEPKLKIMGIEAVKSSTPMSCRKAIIDALKIVMTNDQDKLHDFVSEFRTKFITLPFDQIAFPRGVQSISQYDVPGAKSVPIHVRGTILFNSTLKRLNLSNKYESIKEGDKVKFSYMKMPNPLHSNVIAAPSTIPREFQMEQYIDYETQFQKAFIDPLTSIVKVIGWNTEPRNTLEEFFQW